MKLEIGQAYDLGDTIVFHSDWTIETVYNKTISMVLPGNPWDNRKKSSFIESLIIGIPASIVVRQTNQRILHPIDGNKRLSTIASFFRNEFCLEELEILTDLEGKNHEAIVSDTHLLRALENNTMRITFIRNCPEELARSICDRLNN